jgi:hypothetical protein
VIPAATVTIDTNQSKESRLRLTSIAITIGA